MNCAIVDVFADRPFSGNPAGVVLLDGPGETGWMQRIAAELAQAATAFLHGDHLRWFSTTVELEICGHGTAATAHLLFERGLATGRVSFDTAAGPLSATRRDGLIERWAPCVGTCFRARQASARGATIEVALESDRVRLAGPCRTVLDGRLAS